MPDPDRPSLIAYSLTRSTYSEAGPAAGEKGLTRSCPLDDLRARRPPRYYSTSLSFPVATSNTNPRTWSECGMNGLPLIRATEPTKDRLSHVLAQIMNREEWLASDRPHALAS